MFRGRYTMAPSRSETFKFLLASFSGRNCVADCFIKNVMTGIKEFEPLVSLGWIWQNTSYPRKRTVEFAIYFQSQPLRNGAMSDLKCLRRIQKVRSEQRAPISQNTWYENMQVTTVWNAAAHAAVRMTTRVRLSSTFAIPNLLEQVERRCFCTLDNSALLFTLEFAYLALSLISFLRHSSNILAVFTHVQVRFLLLTFYARRTKQMWWCDLLQSRCRLRAVVSIHSSNVLFGITYWLHWKRKCIG